MNDINLHRISIYIYFLLFIPVFYPAWESLALLWNGHNGDYSHGFLILIITAYLLIRQLSQKSAFTGDINYFFLLILAALSFVWSLTQQANIQIGSQLLLPGIILLFFMSLFGLKRSKIFIFPSLYLIFAMPVWGGLNVPLQIMAVFVNTHLLGLINIPAFIDGFYVTIPAGTFEVAGGCSGVRYLMVSLSLFSLYAFDNYKRWSNRIILIVVAIIVATATNWIRIFIIIVAGQTTNMESSLVEDHDFFGWIVFAVALIPLFIFALKLPDWLSDEKPIQKSSDVKLFKQKYSVKVYLLLSAATFLIPTAFALQSTEHDSVRLAPIKLELKGAPLSEVAKIIKPDFKDADLTFNETFMFEGSILQVFISSYVNQTQGRELIHWENEKFINNWKLLSQEKLDDFFFMEVKKETSDEIVIIAKKYNIGDISTTNKRYAKLYEILKPIMKNKASSAVFIASKCGDSCDEAKRKVSSFIKYNSDFASGHSSEQ
jgi:exosortase A